MALKELELTTQLSETARVISVSALEMYDRNPVVGSIGFLALTCYLPLKAILNHFYAIKEEDNKLVAIKLKAKLEAHKISVQKKVN
ncbi:hypothetical protein [Aliivibrio fischeri]|uniref:hypothetical protein n=1 Tax=Aliivibrio fischeri TaxID=668 RepID=UPI0012DA6054|nr:hypothetical protein [Aliivibrio fischeri]MUJ36021.1 hypothetical protein [Aliivibrio fischeri]